MALVRVVRLCKQFPVDHELAVVINYCNASHVYPIGLLLRTEQEA